MDRRTFLITSAAAMAAPRRAKIAAVITAYYRNSHADVFIENMLRGYYWEGKPHESELEIVAMYEALMSSSFNAGRKEETPHLDVRYRAQRQSLFMRGPLPPYDRIRV